MNAPQVLPGPMVSAEEIEQIVATAPIHDIHTHLYDPAFGGLLLWGIDELLVYHYLVSEFTRIHPIPYENFWKLSKPEQAELIWDSLFVRQTPISEACRGIVTTLNKLGLDVKKRDLSSLRKWFAQINPEDYVDRCLSMANVKSVCMTNSPFDDDEVATWGAGFTRDSRFVSGLRIDPLLLGWPEIGDFFNKRGYQVETGFNLRTRNQLRLFLERWTQRMEPKYLMVSLPPDFAFPANSAAATLLERVVLPHCRDFNLPLALMMGVKRSVNPMLKLAGDGVGRSDLQAIENLCAQNPENKFMVTVLSRENQHELCVLARKFRNLHLFGCWWFTNVPSLIEEITTLRIELLGTSFTAQHSDARILDQLIYKWDHTREILSKVLVKKYGDIQKAGWVVTREEVQRDTQLLLGGSFEKFCCTEID